jgi:hypothetical protein
MIVPSGAIFSKATVLHNHNSLKLIQTYRPSRQERSVILKGLYYFEFVPHHTLTNVIDYLATLGYEHEDIISCKARRIIQRHGIL